MGDGLVSCAVSVVCLTVALWANACLAACSLLVRGRMPARFYTAAAGRERAVELLCRVWRYAGVLTCAGTVGGVCVARALLRRLAYPDRTVQVRQPERGPPVWKWLQHTTIKIQNVKLHYVSAGRNNRRLILFLHGFPEFWYSWKAQLEEFSRTEWVVAVDLPGYGDSDCPAGRRQYHVDHLMPLLLDFIATLGRDQCVLVGSDSGALIGWQLVQRAPKTFSHFVSVSQPLPHITLDILENSIHWKIKLWRRYLYMLPWLPELLITSGDLDILEAEFGDMRRRGLMSPEESRLYQFAFSRPEDWRGPLNHQRTLFSSANRRPPPDRVSVPTLLVFGRRDWTLPPDAMYRNLPYLRDTDIQLVQDAGKRVHMERPEEMNRLIRHFIGVLEAVDDEEEEAQDLGSDHSPDRSLAWRAIEGGCGWLGAGGELYNNAIDRVNNATVLGQLYTRSVMLLKD